MKNISKQKLLNLENLPQSKNPPLEYFLEMDILVT